MIFDRRVWLYTLRFILILVIMVGSGFLLIASIAFPPASYLASFFGSGGVAIMFLGALLSAYIVSARLSVALPAVAVDVPNFGFSNAWKATEGNELRLFIVTFLPSFPVLLLFMQLSLNGSPLFDAPLSWTPFVLRHFALTFVEFAFGLLTLTVLSLTYAFFAKSEGARHGQA